LLQQINQHTLASEDFVSRGSIVRQIWGRSDIILFIFAGGAAEFALNKAVDWLYFTGRLPVDPVGRLFSTVTYAQAIVFSKEKDALKAIDAMSSIHAGVEQQRGMQIPDWAYRDVLFMLIDYSIRSFEIFERALETEEKKEVFNVFNRVGRRMGLKGLPSTYENWIGMRQEHLNRNLAYSEYTDDLFEQYRKHLGAIRYNLLLEAQRLIVPAKVRKLLGLRSFSLLKPVILLYKLSRHFKLDSMIKRMALPPKYRGQLGKLEYLSA
jgi:hypothetical protein